MGYESNLVLCKRKTSRSKAVEQLAWAELGKITYDYWNMPNGKRLTDLFRTPLGSTLVIDGITCKEDPYGDAFKTASCEDVIRYLRKFLELNEDADFCVGYALEHLEFWLNKNKKISDRLVFVHVGT